MHFIKHQPGASYGTNFVYKAELWKNPAEIWKNIKYEIRETFQNYLEANLMNQIHNVCYELTYLFLDVKLFLNIFLNILKYTNFRSPILHFSSA